MKIQMSLPPHIESKLAGQKLTPAQSQELERALKKLYRWNGSSCLIGIGRAGVNLTLLITAINQFVTHQRKDIATYCIAGIILINSIMGQITRSRSNKMLRTLDTLADKIIRENQNTH